MKLECDKSKIELSYPKNIKISKQTFNFTGTSCVYFEVLNDNKLIIKSTNLDIGVEIETKIKTIEKGALAVPANILLGVLSSIKDNKSNF